MASHVQHPPACFRFSTCYSHATSSRGLSQKERQPHVNNNPAIAEREYAQAAMVSLTIVARYGIRRDAPGAASMEQDLLVERQAVATAVQGRPGQDVDVEL